MMRPIIRGLLGGAGIMLLIFGWLCLNYTKAVSIEHHQEVARRRGLPQPSESIRWGGVATVVLGAGLIGHVLGAGKRTIASSEVP